MKNWRLWVILVVVCAVVLVFVAKSKKETPEKVSQVVEETNSLPVLVELGGHGCKACEAMKPVLADLENEYGDRLEIRFHDVRSNPEYGRQYGIRVIPTQIFLDKDGNEIHRHEGYYSKEEIVRVFRDGKLIQ